MKNKRIRLNFLPTLLIYRRLKNRNKSLNEELQSAIHEFDGLLKQYNNLWMKNIILKKIILKNNIEINTENESNPN